MATVDASEHLNLVATLGGAKIFPTILVRFGINNVNCPPSNLTIHLSTHGPSDGDGL